MLTLTDILGYQGLPFGDFLLFFIYLCIFSIRPTDQISGNAFDAKRKKMGMAQPYKDTEFESSQDRKTLAWEQALRGALAAGREKEGGL